MPLPPANVYGVKQIYLRGRLVYPNESQSELQPMWDSDDGYRQYEHVATRGYLLEYYRTDIIKFGVKSTQTNTIESYRLFYL